MLDSSIWTWYLNATAVLWMLLVDTVYSPTRSGTAVIKAGFGATFSRTAKLSIRMVVVGGFSPPWGLNASAISPAMKFLMGTPFSKEVLTDSTIDEESPGWAKSGCLIAVAARLVIDPDDFIECVSEPSSVSAVPGRGVIFIGVNGGEPVSSGVNGFIGLGFKSGGLGMNMVLRTSRASRRPLVLRETVCCCPTH